MSRRPPSDSATPPTVGTYRPPDPAPPPPPAPDAFEADLEAIQTGVLAARRRAHAARGGLVVLAVLFGRVSAPLGPWSPAASTGAVIDSIGALRSEAQRERIALAQRDSARDAAVIAALTTQALVLCEIVPPARTRARGFPCRRLQDGEHYPLFGATAPGTAPLLTVRAPAPELPELPEVPDAPRE